MDTEFEAKILEVDVEAVTAQIERTGGVRVSGPRLQKRWVFDLDRPSRWIRLRDDGVTATLAVKDIADDGIAGTREAETEVADVAAALEILRLMGFTPKAYQENRRTSFRLGDVRLEIDEWPHIPPYLEIEGDDEEAVLAAAARLGFPPAALTGENTTKIYQRYGLDLADHPRLCFETVVSRKLT